MAFKFPEIDYDKIEADRMAKMTPAELSDYKHAKDVVAIETLSTTTLPATFTGLRWNEGTKALDEVATWKRPVTPRMEYRQEREGGLRRILHFHGAVTGYEAFEIDNRMLKELEEGRKDPGKTWGICAGSAKYDRCEVAMADVAGFVALEEVRREALMKTVREEHAPPVVAIEGRMARDGAFIEDAATVRFTASVDRARDSGAGHIGDKLLISALSAHDERPLDRELRATIDALAKEGKPFVVGGTAAGEATFGYAMPAAELKAAIAECDKAYARDLRAYMEAAPRMHSVALEGREDRIVASVSGGKGGERALTLEGEGFAARTPLTPQVVAAIEAKGREGTLVATSAEREAKGLPSDFKMRAGDILAVLAHEGAADGSWLRRKAKDNARDNAKEEVPVFGLPETGGRADEAPEATPRTRIEDAFKGAPHQYRDAKGRDLVGVQVSRHDLDALLGRHDANDKAIGDQAYGQALNFFVMSLRQPVYKDFKPTGEERAGIAAVSLLQNEFGKAPYRKVWLDKAEMAKSIADPSKERGFRTFVEGDGAAFLGALAEGSAKREAALAAAKERGAATRQSTSKKIDSRGR